MMANGRMSGPIDITAAAAHVAIAKPRAHAEVARQPTVREKP
jgi:hypothetical protein